VLEQLWEAVFTGPRATRRELVGVLVRHGQVARAQAVAATMACEGSDLERVAEQVVHSFVENSDGQAALGVPDHVDKAARDQFADLVRHELDLCSLAPDEIVEHAVAGTLDNQDPAYDLFNHVVNRMICVGRVDDAWSLCESTAASSVWKDDEHLQCQALFTVVLPALVARDRVEDALRLLGPLDQVPLEAISPDSGLPELALLLVRRGEQAPLATLVTSIERDLADDGREGWEFELAGPDPVRTCLAVALCGLGRDDDAVAAAVAHEEAFRAEAELLVPGVPDPDPSLPDFVQQEALSLRKTGMDPDFRGNVPEWELIAESLVVTSRSERVEQLVAERAPGEWNHLLLLSGALRGLARTGQDWSTTYDQARDSALALSSRARRSKEAGAPAYFTEYECGAKANRLFAALVDVGATDTARVLLDTVSVGLVLEDSYFVVDDRVRLARTYAGHDPDAALGQLLAAWQAGGWPRGAEVLADMDEEVFVELVDRWTASL